jgi:hypothetical protein
VLLLWLCESRKAEDTDVKARLKLQKPVHSAEAGAEVCPGAAAAVAAEVAAAAGV